jgi:hypothetical protein
MSAQDVIQSQGRIAEHGAMRWACCRVQGVAFARGKEEGEDSTRVGIRDGEFPIEVVADERREHNVHGAASVQPFQGGPETSRQLLQAGVIGL